MEPEGRASRLLTERETDVRVQGREGEKERAF
jgi:hypothetical protein